MKVASNTKRTKLVIRYKPTPKHCLMFKRWRLSWFGNNVENSIQKGKFLWKYKRVHKLQLLKALILITFLSPGFNRKKYLLVSNESPYISHYNTKISASNSYIGSYSRKCAYFRHTNFDFLMYFLNDLIPSVTNLFFGLENRIKRNLEVKLC